MTLSFRFRLVSTWQMASLGVPVRVMLFCSTCLSLPTLKVRNGVCRIQYLAGSEQAGKHGLPPEARTPHRLSIIRGNLGCRSRVHLRRIRHLASRVIPNVRAPVFEDSTKEEKQLWAHQHAHWPI